MHEHTAQCKNMESKNLPKQLRKCEMPYSINSNKAQIKAQIKAPNFLKKFGLNIHDGILA